MVETISTRAVVILLLAILSVAHAQNRPASKENAIADQVIQLRNLPDDVRARTTKKLALEIRQLAASPNKRNLASNLATFSTEGDFGRDTLQEVTTTLTEALREQPIPMKDAKPSFEYVELAQLSRYEGMKVSFNDPQYSLAMAKLEGDDEARRRLDFTLSDMQGKSWTLKSLTGKVVLVNFWATWCPPCRKEMPDLDVLYRRFKEQGLVILAISDEDEVKVKLFIAERRLSFPTLLDPGRKVNEAFRINGIPKSFVYDRSGKLVAQSIDMRTQKQFLDLLAHAGLH